tara:strand:- start:479 stop:643 length:165 start_codon:yes stop_codon:yes gene_type:complete
MEKLTGKWHLKKRFFGGYDVYVQVRKFGIHPIQYYRKIKDGEEYELYDLNNKNK